MKFACNLSIVRGDKDSVDHVKNNLSKLTHLSGGEVLEGHGGSAVHVLVLVLWGPVDHLNNNEIYGQRNTL